MCDAGCGGTGSLVPSTVGTTAGDDKEDMEMATRAQVMAAINASQALLTDHKYASKAQRDDVMATLTFVRTVLDHVVFKGVGEDDVEF